MKTEHRSGLGRSRILEALVNRPVVFHRTSMKHCSRSPRDLAAAEFWGPLVTRPVVIPGQGKENAPARPTVTIKVTVLMCGGKQIFGTKA